VWSSIPGVELRFGTNKGKAEIVISSEASVGPGLLRLFNEEGPSDLRFFVVTEGQEQLEIEPNNHFTRPQWLTNLPTTINGRLEKSGDVDCFRITMKAGQWLDANVESYTLMAKLDPVLRLVTTNGYQLAWNHDFSSLDPRLVWQAPYDLTAVLQVFGFVYPANADIRLSGGDAAVYRLNLMVDFRPPRDLREEFTEAQHRNATNEPGDEIVGNIQSSSETDRYRFSLKKDQIIEARVRAAAIGSPLDAWLAIENPSGNELARNDDAENSRDPRLEWKVPEDGTYSFRIGSLTHYGGPEYRYHLISKTLAPDYTLTSSADAIALTSGATNTLKLNFKRLRGFTNELTAAVSNLPEGVVVEPIVLPAKDGDPALVFSASTNAPPTNVVFRIDVSDKQSGEIRPVPFDLVSRTENNGVPGGYSKLLVEHVDQLWLTIRSPATNAAPKK
jgi:hypothetical protein